MVAQKIVSKLPAQNTNRHCIPSHRPRACRRRTAAVLAPTREIAVSRRPDGKSGRTELVTITQPAGGLGGSWLWEGAKSIAVQAFQGLKFYQYIWPRSASVPSQPQKEEVLEKTTEKLMKVEEQEKSDVAKAQAKTKKPPVNIHNYLFKVGIMEIRYIRMLASLCAQTYYMPKLTDRALFRRHGLRLVTSSLIYERMTRDFPRSASQIMSDADAMAASPQLVALAQRDLQDSTVKEVPAMQALAKLKETEPLGRMPTPGELVASRIQAAAAAAAAAAAPLASNISTAAAELTSAAASAAAGTLPLQALGSQLQGAAAAGQSTALASMATVMAALESTWNKRSVTKAQATSSSYWYVADDVEAHTRFFTIQGSDNIDHWRINLTFDPVVFEDPALGLKVHRGVYEAAQILYDQFLPLIEEHMASSPFAKIVFTGHSLGGSLGTLLMLMCVIRKVVPPLAIGPVYTFGAPAIFCESESCRLQATSDSEEEQSSKQEEASSSGRVGVLERLGLNSGAIRNIMMHRDIVPRAFACDYSLVADLLSRVSESFKMHECLHAERQVMYYFLGRTLVLQPDEEHSFVYGVGDHPMLPRGPNLYTLREPWKLQRAASRLGQAVQKLDNHLSNIQPAASISSQARSAAGASGSKPEARVTGEDNLGADGGNIDDSGPDKAGGAQLGPPARSLTDAVMALMDTPHPLDILGEPGSYGFQGAISRYHNPDNYTRALGGVLRARTQPWRSLGSGAATARAELRQTTAPVRRSRKVRNLEQDPSRAQTTVPQAA